MYNAIHITSMDSVPRTRPEHQASRSRE